jgi:phospholipid/cholesterol/gamma-HCH transport system substrate-binding protein
MGPVFKRLAVNYPPILFHPINSITAYKGQIIYDTPETEAKAQTPVPYLQWNPAPGVTPPVMNPDGTLTDLILPPPPVVGQVSQAGVPAQPPMGAGPLPGPPPGAPLPAEQGGG